VSRASASDTLTAHKDGGLIGNLVQNQETFLESNGPKHLQIQSKTAPLAITKSAVL